MHIKIFRFFWHKYFKLKFDLHVEILCFVFKTFFFYHSKMLQYSAFKMVLNE